MVGAYIPSPSPDAELIQFLGAIVVEVVTRKCLVCERPRPKTALVIVSIQRDWRRYIFRSMPWAPKATNRDSTCIGIDGDISAFERVGKVVRKIEGEERCVVLWEGKPLKTGTSCRGCLHANAVIECERKIPRRCVSVYEIRLGCYAEVQQIRYHLYCSSGGAHGLQG